MPPKKYKQKGIELKIDFGSGLDPVPVQPIPAPQRQVQFTPKPPQQQAPPQQRSPFDDLEEERKQAKQAKRQIIDTTKQMPQQQAQKQPVTYYDAPQDQYQNQKPFGQPQKQKSQQQEESKVMPKSGQPQKKQDSVGYPQDMQQPLQSQKSNKQQTEEWKMPPRQVVDKNQEQPQPKAAPLEKREVLTPKIDPSLSAEIQSMLATNNDFNKSINFGDAVNNIYNEVVSVLKSCPQGQQVQDLPSHVFGQQQIQPLVPHLMFELSKDQQSFDGKFGRFTPMPQGQVLSKLLNEEDMILHENLLDSLFEFDVTQLKKQAACAAIKFDAHLMMTPKLDTVYRGIAGFHDANELSCTALDLDFQTSLMEHDLFSGEILCVNYRDQMKAEEISALNDDREIDDILMQTCDPLSDQLFVNASDQEDNLVSQFQTFLSEFKSSVMQQMEASEIQKISQQKIQEQEHNQIKQSAVDEEVDSDSEQLQAISEGGVKTSDDQIEQRIEPQNFKDDIDEIAQSSETYKLALQKSQLTDRSISVQAEPSRFNLAVVAKERLNQESATQKLQELSKTSDQQWVIKDTLDMKNFKDLIPDPALAFNFELDEFQKRAIYRLEQGNCVMVAAHTSAGKTAVAEYAIALSRRHMTKTIYTSPIKSLSNQKYRDFKLKFGDVGVVTGDVQLNRNASCLIMTTEVLQAMLYNGIEAVQDVEWVIFDEVHYINDPERGSVWEEVIMKLPDTVSIIMLSATVPNYLEFANWVGRTKQKKVYVQYTDKRPVPLMHHMMLEGKLSLIKDQEKPVDQILLNKVIAARKNLKFGDGKKDGKKDQKEDEGNPDKINQQSKEEKNKKIDFKEKANKAKEGAMKKMLAKNTGGSSGKGPNQGAGKKKSNSFQKTLQQIEQLKLLPCIVFAFSRAGTFQYAEGLDPTTDFTDGYTKGLIRKFIKQKLQRLDEVDRELPQIMKITGLLIRGIGVHHAGLLQILKELVEILFSDGYLKVVFATSTFAIGLNLPARCVMFTGMRKFNGTENATIEASEYLQMAGRAGRRGKDDRGFSVICADPDLGSSIPSKTEMIDLLDSKGVELASQLRIDYRTCMNVLKQESGEIGSMLQSSFFANEDMSIKLQNIKSKKIIEPLYEKTKLINCVHGVPDQALQFFDLIDKLWEANLKLNKNLAPVLMQIVEVTTAKHILQPMIVIKVQANRCLCLFTQKTSESWPLQYDERVVDESLVELQKKNQPKSISTDNGIYSYEYVWVYFEMISKFYTNLIEIGQLQFVSQKELNEKQLRLIIKQYSMMKALKDDIPKKVMVSTRAHQQEIIQQMKETKCWGCDLLSYHITQVETHAYYKKEMEGILKVLSGGVDEKENDFNVRNSVLMEYKIIDSDLNLLYKGKVAAKADNIILCEFFFSGYISVLTDCELLALLSVFCLNEKAGGNVEDCSKQYSENFTKASNFIYDETEKLLAIEVEKGIVVEDNTIEKRTNYKFYEMVYDWADQKSFAEVIEESTIDEGIVVKMIMSVNRQRQRIQEMATFVGDNSLAERVKGMQDLIIRGIVRMQSLYLEVEQEPPRLNLQNEEIADFRYEESKI